MTKISFLDRIESETGVSIKSYEDTKGLAGIFTRYRPDGEGLERLFSGEGVEQQVLKRLLAIFQVTASGWSVGDLYFIVRRPVKVTAVEAADLARDFLAGIAEFSRCIGEDEVFEALDGMNFRPYLTQDVRTDEDISIMIYEFVADFLAKFQPNDNEIFLLKEAIYSMSNDYFLLAFVLWPAISGGDGMGCPFDRYFDLWRAGVSIEYYCDASYSVRM